MKQSNLPFYLSWNYKAKCGSGSKIMTMISLKNDIKIVLDHFIILIFVNDLQ